MRVRDYIRWIVFLIVSLLFPEIALAGNLTPRDWAVDTITPIPTLRLNNITEQFGGSNVTNAGPNFGGLIFSAISTYSDAIGQVAFVILFAIPFIMMWIVNADMTLPAIVGIVFSAYVFVRIPSQYIFFAVGAFAISVVALLWSLYRKLGY
jgi:hypothetical protein